MHIFWRVLIINGCWISSKAFLFLSIEIIMWFLSFNLLICYITLINLCIWKNPCIPGINPSWSWCTSFLMSWWILLAEILLRIFTSMFISDTVCSFVFCVLSLSGFGIGWWWPRRMSLEVFLPLQFFERVLEG